jgi:hypothetical protein
MTDNRSTDRPDTGSGGELLTIRPSTTAEDVLAALKRQGISDLESLAKAALAKVREKAEEEEEDAPGDTTSLDFCIFKKFMLIRTTQE